MTPGFGGTALGAGPVRPLIASGQDPSHGLALNPTVREGWYSFKTLWFSDPSYQGPARIRAAQIDGPGRIAFGEAPDLGELVIPPGPTLNSSAGYREAPGGTWLKGSGCYAWQVDGEGFTTIIVFVVHIGTAVVGSG